MKTYTLGATTAAAAAGAMYWQIRASTDRVRVREVGAFVNAATASSIGLIRAASIGSGFTGQLFQAQDGTDEASITNGDTAATGVPTIAGTPIYLRKAVIPATIGNGVIWTWPVDAPLIIAPSGGLLLWNFGAGAGSALSVYAVIEE